jgi:hypothetical protein
MIGQGWEWTNEFGGTSNSRPEIHGYLLKDDRKPRFFLRKWLVVMMFDKILRLDVLCNTSRRDVEDDGHYTAAYGRSTTSSNSRHLR